MLPDITSFATDHEARVGDIGFREGVFLTAADAAGYFCGGVVGGRGRTGGRRGVAVRGTTFAGGRRRGAVVGGSWEGSRGAVGTAC